MVETAARSGMPKAQFIEDVKKFLNGRSVDESMKTLQDEYQKYKLFEMRIHQQRMRLQVKLPDIRKTLEIVNHLCEKEGSDEEIVADYQLADGIYAKAGIQGAQSVYLWLGANVMLEYSLTEAKELLEKNLSSAKENLDTLRSDAFFLRDQITTTEVSLARVYNYGVALRRENAGKEEA